MLSQVWLTRLQRGLRIVVVLLLVTGFMGMIGLVQSAGPPPSRLVASANFLAAGNGLAPSEPPQLDGQIYRAQNGQVYQVLRHRRADGGGTGVDAGRVTMVIGSLGSISSCSAAGNGPPNAEPAEAITASRGNQVYTPTLVFKSERISDASTPCFNPLAMNGNGLVCQGLGCDLSCNCVGGNCQSFTIADGISILVDTPTIPAATVMTTVNSPGPGCEFVNRGVYAFEAPPPAPLAPTTQVPLCDPTPLDGFTLPGTPSVFVGGVDGTTVIFAYDVSPVAAFSVGMAGFLIDTNGFNTLGCTADSVLGAAVQSSTTAPPLGIHLETFAASAAGNRVRVTWETSMELGNLGFNLYRSQDPSQLGTALNAALIPSQAPQSGQGFAYEWVDEQVEVGMTYHYSLEDVALTGETTQYGPVSVTVAPPTAISLARLGVASQPHSLLLALSALLLAGLVVVRVAWQSHAGSRNTGGGATPLASK